ncbi:MAG TPA: hypothetical protein VM056_03545 [Terriglobales bacterium]|nr:hypothetical protein [Terriglobales bacterium]
MAVYKRSYRPYDGSFTPQASRFMVIPRYAFASLFDSRPLLTFFIGCFFPTLLAIALIYITNSPTARAVLSLNNLNTNQTDIFAVNGFFFVKYIICQGFLSFLLTAWVGPGLVSMDLSNDALPLYLSRPFSRLDYLLGKFMVLAIMLSAITWVPGLLLFGLQSSLAGWTWLSQNYWIAGSIVVGAWVWIIVLSLLVLAISAWIRWKIAATALMLAIFFIGPGFGEAMNEILRIHWGKLLNLGYLIGRVWYGLFRVPSTELGDIQRFRDVPLWSAWAVLTGVVLFSLFMLNKKLKAREVVR